MENYFILIPNEICERADLTQSEKLVFGFIFAVTVNQKYTTASNQDIAAVVKLSPTTISDVVSSLVTKKLIRRKIWRHKDSKEVFKRDLYVTIGHSNPPRPRTDTLPVPERKSVLHNTVIGVTKKTPPNDTTLIGSTQSDLLVQNKKNTTVTVTLPTDPIEAWDEIPNYPDFYSMPVEQKPKTKEEFFVMSKEWAEKTCEQGRSKHELYPCTYEEIWHIAMNKRLTIEEVVEKHCEMIRLINEGQFKNQYGKPYGSTVYFTLQNWLELGIRRGRYQQLDDIQMMSIESEEPVKRREHRFLVQLRERAKAEGKI